MGIKVVLTQVDACSLTETKDLGFFATTVVGKSIEQAAN
jgi:hypothetical protein